MSTTTDAAIEEPEFRVTCPDGLEHDRFTGPDAERWARLDAANCDDMHDSAKCPGPHRVERSKGWETINREEPS